MKTKLPTNRAGVAVAALLASIGFSTSAKAITLAYEVDPDGAGPLTVGSPYAGPVQFKFVNFDNGSLYATLPPGPGVGYSGVPSAIGEATGVTALDAIQAAGAGNAKSNGQYLSGLPAGARLEDTWGILNTTNITDLNGFDVWTPAGKGTQITGMFYGEQDIHIQNFSATENRINGVGLTLDLYEQPILGGTPFSPVPGPADFPVGGRTGPTSYLNVTDGTLVLKLESTPGFIQTLGTGAGPAAEFETIFNTAALVGRGTSFANVVGGADMGSLTWLDYMCNHGQDEQGWRSA